jgi:hypothetical protein
MSNSYPSWYDIDDLESVTEVKLRLILEQAEKCYADAKAGYDGLKKRSEILAIALSGFLVAMFSYFVQNFDCDANNLPANLAIIWMFVCLLCATIMLSQNLFTTSVDLKGRPPKTMLIKQIAQENIEYMLLYLILNEQAKIDYIREIKPKIAKHINQSTKLALVTPVAGLVVYVIMKMMV